MILSALKTHLPWWAKIGGKIILARIPISYSVWQTLGLFRHGRMDIAEYAQGIFSSHLERAGISPSILKDKTILEIGPGDSIASAIIAYAYGAKSILVDAGPFAKNTPESYRGLCDSLASHGLPVPDLSNIGSIEQLLAVCHGQYLTNGLKSWGEIASESVDLIFSQAVLEHIRKHEFLMLQQECLRVLKPGAVASHRIDLQDHLGGALNNLRFSEGVWESDFFVNSGFYTNRIQMNEMLKHFSDAGFDVELTEVRRWNALPTPRKKMNAVFANQLDENLNVSGFDVILKRKELCVD